MQGRYFITEANLTDTTDVLQVLSIFYQCSVGENYGLIVIAMQPMCETYTYLKIDQILRVSLN